MWHRLSRAPVAAILFQATRSAAGLRPPRTVRLRPLRIAMTWAGRDTIHCKSKLRQRAYGMGFMPFWAIPILALSTLDLRTAWALSQVRPIGRCQELRRRTGLYRLLTSTTNSQRAFFTTYRSARASGSAAPGAGQSTQSWGTGK